MGKLNLLHHKSWHVYSKDNREKVRKDEEKADFAEQEKLAKVVKADQEFRLSQLRNKASSRNSSSQKIHQEKDKEKEKEKEKNEKPKHVNLFEDLERLDGAAELVMSEKDIEQKKKEDRHTMFLGETRDGKKESTWYATLDAKSGEKVMADKLEDSKRLKSEEKRKMREDPMQFLKQLRQVSRVKDSSNSRVRKSGIEMTRQELRQERLEREQQERNRTNHAINPGESAHEKEGKYYNNQFNRDLKRK